MLGENSGMYYFPLPFHSPIPPLFLDPECGSQNATLAVLVVISSLKITKAFLIRSGAQRNFAYTFVFIFPQICRLRFSTYFLINQ